MDRCSVVLERAAAIVFVAAVFATAAAAAGEVARTDVDADGMIVLNCDSLSGAAAAATPETAAETLPDLEDG